MSEMKAKLRPFKDYPAKHFRWQVDASGRVATITLNRPDKKNPLTFESYEELRDLFTNLKYASDVRTIVLTGADGNFCSGGDVFEIIEPLTRMAMPDLLAFTRMTGEVVRAMRKCPQIIVAAIDGICAGAGAMLALASDLRRRRRRARPGALARRWAVVRAWRDQDDVQPGMGDGRRRDDRVGSAGAGDLHGDRRLPPRLRGVRRQAETGLRGQLR